MRQDQPDPLHNVSQLGQEAEIRSIIEKTANYSAGSLQDSQITLRKAISLAKQLGFLPLEAQAQSQLCKVLLFSSDLDRRLIAIEQGRALALYRELRDELNQARSLISLGHIANNTADYVAGLDYLDEAEEICNRLGNPALSRQVFNKLTGLHHSLGNKNEAMLYANRAVALLTAETDPDDWTYTYSLQGHAYSLAGQHAKAVASLEASLGYCEKISSAPRRVHFYAHALADLSEMFLAWGKPEEALLWAEKAEIAANEADMDGVRQKSWSCAGRAALALGNHALAKEKLGASLILSRKLGAKAQEASDLFDLSSVLAKTGQHEEALDAYRTAHKLEAGFQLEEATRRMEFRRVKKDIDDAKRDMEAADRILFTVLPESIAKRIKGGESRIAEEIPEVSILFADLVGFTAMSTKVSPTELLSRLELIFSSFDQLTTSMRLEKIKTIGDAYMVVGGVLDDDADHVERAAKLALQMTTAVAQISASLSVDLAIRIGLHAGPAIAGVIGKSKLSYDLWGETINLASRLESSGAPGRVHVSESVAKRLGKLCNFEHRGMIEL